MSISHRTPVVLTGVLLKDFPPREFALVVAITVALTLLASFANAVGLVFFFTGTGHVSGAATKLLPLLFTDSFRAILPATILCCYITGAAITGFILRAPKLRWGRRQGVILLLESVCFVFAGVGLSLCERTHPGEAVPLLPTVFLGAMSIGMGLQNGILSSFSALVIRTTNVTGTAVDTGIAIGQTLADRSTRHLWKIRIWVPQWVAFGVGSAAGAAACYHGGAPVILVSAAAALAMGVATLLVAQRHIGQGLPGSIFQSRFAAAPARRHAAVTGVVPVADVSPLLVDRSERLIKPGDSWFSPKAI
eukprot:TRINITY_DN11974_c0_g1_i1.p1 TRINITY_DN11974_c0_g1~~TRINITY_DN11974_c0_g1_i1.p1  ORF type:complete len:306 (-),score=50.09 TRINITY_DN11974_c0_g1_i1:12-929(-)